ncbi:MAG: CBS domain-containing protein [Candidatus Micrarchaeota archaeon]|nr:CBS domain-containing protein [Candidatus Micrarchaeota archaeon]MDE1824068.1 CBS domain-containing protein [Candidatus Micrarchaeota archaeon]
MPYDIDDLNTLSSRLRSMRKALGVSQKKLAAMLGLSQATIARIESDIESLNPSYQTIFRISEGLNGLEKETGRSVILSKKAHNIMHRNIFSVKPGTTVAQTISIIKNYDFPQIPVIDPEGNSVGTVYQKDLLEIATRAPESVEETKIRDIMEASLPQVARDTEVLRLKPVLESWGAVLVVDKKKVVGIVTMYDVLKLV